MSFHFNLGVVYRHQEKIDEAIAAYTQAVTLDRAYVKAWYDLGHMHRLNHDNEKAVEAFRKYLALVEGKDPQGAKRAREEIQALE